MSPAASTRWCPTPEQVMILEEMYRGGVRTPNAAQIQQITSHLSHYGKIEGKNVFYWFQNHKARDRQKLRKKLLGKQFQQHQQILFSHNTFLYHPFDQLPLPHHNTYLHFDLPPPPPPPSPPPPPPPSLPCFGPTPSSLSLFNQLLPPLNSPCFAAHQGRAEDVVQGVTNTFTWNSDENYGREKTKPSSLMRIITNDDHDDDHHHHEDKNNSKNDDENDAYSRRRPLKTLELFPIKDKTSLK